MSDRLLAFTIDTEVDKGPDWRVSDPVTFRSVTEAIPRILSPLFDEFGAVPTYLLSAEVIEDEPASSTLLALGDTAELGAHLHLQFLEPSRSLRSNTMAGASVDAIQADLDRQTEASKIENLTRLFSERFGRRPTSFRAGRFGWSPHTLETLSALGYRVDSSVTPGIRWRYTGTSIDFRSWNRGPRRVATGSGEIIELPVTIVPGSRFSRMVESLPEVLRNTVRRALPVSAGHRWLRPSWARPGDLSFIVESTEDQIMVAMVHSMEFIPGASPYARSDGDVERIVASVRELLECCSRQGIRVVGLTEAGSCSG